ncbi:MAG: lectin [Longimicrobiales bacterium]
MKSMLLTLPVLILFGATSCTSSSDDLADNADTEHMMSFFLTSVGSGNGGDLGGLEGADQHCQALATAAGFGDQMWNAYLSSTGSDGSSGINARDRIGSGPWYNFAGDQVATDVDNLHGENNLTKETVLNELGAMTNGRGDDPNRHDILTGTQLDGTAAAGDGDTTCQNWTGSGEGSALVGHFDRIGGGDNPTSWNSAHASRGCGQEDLRGTGGDGLFYCFAY